MRQSSKSVAARTVDPWAPFSPTDERPWNLRRVVHLHRRAGFGATWRELERDLKDGPEPSLERVLAGRASVDGVPDKFEKTADLLGESAVASGDPARLKAWWVYRMLFGPDPLTERLTLFWHNHFATSNLKVENLAFMRRQNELFRQLGRGPFGELLTAVVHDAAMLIWLDAPSNRKGHPNENLARADGAVQPGDRTFHRARRQGGRPRPHGLEHQSRRLRRGRRSPRRRRKGDPGKHGTLGG